MKKLFLVSLFSFLVLFLLVTSFFSFLTFFGCGRSRGTPVIPSATLIPITIFSSNSSVVINGTIQLTAIDKYSDNSTEDITTSVTWFSSNTSVATIDSSGKLTGVSTGTTTITATKDGITSNSVTITVSSGTPLEEWIFKGYTLGKQIGNEIGGVLMPEVVLFDGTYRMYYGLTWYYGYARGSASIKYAESSDGINWKVKGTSLAGATDPSDREYNIKGPSVVKLSNGQFRMYYESSPKQQPGEPPKFHVRSAISNDGINWTKEGVRLEINSVDPSSPLRLAGHGTYFIVSNGTTVGLFSGEFTTDPVGPSDIKMATSLDGLNFSGFKTLYEDWHDPIVIKESNGYRMYATYLLEKQGTAFSSDGLTWPPAMTDVSFVDSYGKELTPGGLGVGDIGGVLLPSSSIRLYTNWGNPPEDIVYFEKRMLFIQEDIVYFEK